jgi:hypothetical protein
MGLPGDTSIRLWSKKWRLRVEGQGKLVILASPEIRELLADNEIDLVELLRAEGLEVRSGSASENIPEAKDGLKEPVTILLASAAVIASLTPIISRVISALTHKRLITKEQVLVPVEDSKGGIIRDSAGSPILHWVERARLLESAASRDHTSLKVEGPVGLTINFEASGEQ